MIEDEKNIKKGTDGEIKNPQRISFVKIATMGPLLNLSDDLFIPI